MFLVGGVPDFISEPVVAGREGEVLRENGVARSHHYRREEKLRVRMSARKNHQLPRKRSRKGGKKWRFAAKRVRCLVI